MSYRLSHLTKGADYDRDLAGDPFDVYMARREREILLAILPRLFPHRLLRSLDFACGTGRIAQILDGIAEQPCGVDVAETMLAEARGKCPRTRFFLHDITEAPLPVEPVQLVTAFRFFGNAENDLRIRALHAIRRCLTPGGYLLLNNHENPWTISALLRRVAGQRPRADLHHWKLRRLLQLAGFQVRRTYGVGLWIYRARLRRADALSSKWATVLERLSLLPFLGRFCPDAVIVAQRI